MLKKNGFNLIELIVSMAIIGILAAAAVVNFANNADRDVRQEKDRLTSFLREVQNKALTGDKVNLTAGAKLCGYGIQMKSETSFKVFFVEYSDLNGDCNNYISSDLAGVAITDMTPDFILKNNVTVESTSLNTSDRIYFLIPHGFILSTRDLPININLTKNSITPIPVSIDPSGRIY